MTKETHPDEESTTITEDQRATIEELSRGGAEDCAAALPIDPNNLRSYVRRYQ